MGILTFNTDEWRVSNEFLDGDVVQVIRDEMADSEEEGEIEHNAEQEVLTEQRAPKKNMPCPSQRYPLRHHLRKELTMDFNLSTFLFMYQTL